MTTGSTRALAPLWAFVLGLISGAALGLTAAVPGPTPLRWLLGTMGAAAAVAALGHRGLRRAVALWLLAGLALGGGRGLAAAVSRHRVARLAADRDAAIRIRATLATGWTRSRWGMRAEAVLAGASRRAAPVVLPRRISLEVRGAATEAGLPPPGATVEALVRVRRTGGRPGLVAASPRLIETVAGPHGIHALRARLARDLLVSAGTDPGRIRAAELAAALALGRRDLVPAARRAVWRRSGLAHLLAVSGLHVGIVAGLVWYAAILLGAAPNPARVAVLLLAPGYAVLAGASPSALRAALMLAAYLGARLLGRAILPMAAVLLAAAALLLASPGLVLDAGFQLTVVITAALVRWATAVAARLPGAPRLRATVAVPIVAQAAALPLVAWHFRTVIPGALVTNVLALPLLFPVLVLALTATAAAALWTAPAAAALVVLHAGAGLVLALGGAARAFIVTAPAPRPWVVLAFVACGILGLAPARAARFGALAWVSLALALPSWWLLRPQPSDGRVVLLPVADGLAALVPGSAGPILVDGGRWRLEAVQLLADRGVRRLGAVVASHTDQDHLGGLAAVLRRLTVGSLVVPGRMRSRPETVPLLREARRRRVRVVAVARGLALGAAGDRLTVLWPPAVDVARPENDRSLVARVRLQKGSVLLTSDIGSGIEGVLARRPAALRADVLVVAHHGSRTSSSPAFLAAVDPAVALIPAGRFNPYHHPGRRTLATLERLGIPFRYPKRDGACGAARRDGRWEAWP